MMHPMLKTALTILIAFALVGAGTGALLQESGGGKTQAKAKESKKDGGSVGQSLESDGR